MAAHVNTIGHRSGDTDKKKHYCIGMRIYARWIVIPLLLGFVIGKGVQAAEEGAEAKIWPGSETMYVYTHPASGYNESLQRAISLWQKLNHPVQIKSVPQASLANVIIHTKDGQEMGRMCQGPCAGRASQFGWRSGTSSITLWDDMPGGITERSALIMHELGHLLGLQHTHGRCSLMHSSFQFSCGQEMFAWQDIMALQEAYPNWKLPAKLQLRPFIP